MFVNTFLCTYSCPHKVLFGNGYEFKLDFNPLLKDFVIKPIFTSVKNLQANDPVEWVYQVILNMLATKDIEKMVFDHIDPWGETLSSIAWAIKKSYHCTIMSTPVQAIFGRDMLFNLAPAVDWRVLTAAKQRQLHIDNGR